MRFLLFGVDYLISYFLSSRGASTDKTLEATLERQIVFLHFSMWHNCEHATLSLRAK